MARSNLLNAAHCRNTKEVKLHPDGNGLFLNVTPTGGKSWLLRIRWKGKRPEIGLGSFSDVSLAEAREIAGDIRKLARSGTDPRQWRAIQDAERQGRRSHALTFDQCIDPVMKVVSAEMSNPKHVAQWESTLRTYASPVIGSMPVDQIEVEHVLEVLQPIWMTKTETASRLRGRMERVFSWAIVNKHRKPPNPATWRGNLEVLLPKPTKARKAGHFAALAYAGIPDFMTALRTHDSLSAKALQLTILTTGRTQEITGAQWSEFDLQRKAWTIPADRMKARREHRVPLTPPMLRLLKSIPKIEDSPFVFPGLKGNPHLSNMAMLQFLKRNMQRPELTVHGFRSSFKDWVMEETGFSGEVSEAQLAHVIGNKAQAAYERGDKFKKRRELLKAWGAYCGY